MAGKIHIVIVALLCFAFNTDSFRDEQMKYPRVRKAYQDREANVISLLNERQILKDGLQIYFRAFKQEREIELWGKNNTDEKYQLIKVYEICRTSGKLGPKRKQGDLQIPEGFYHINRFNPYSNFYLSLGLNYPNKSDRILGVEGNLGGDIFIHGACVTIGCMPITDAEIKELYIFCVEARSNGQTTIPVTVFPAKLTDETLAQLNRRFSGDTDKLNLWADLKKGFDIFNESHKLPSIKFLSTGRHKVE